MNFNAPLKTCLMPSHILEKSPVNRPLKVLTSPMITFSAPSMTPLIFSHTVLTIKSIALNVTLKILLMTGSVALTIPRIALSTGSTTNQMLLKITFIDSSICCPSESQKDFISLIFSEKKVTTALIAFVTLSFIKLKPDFIESTTYNTVSLVVRNSFIPLTALKKASLVLAITFLKLSDLAYAIVKPATRAVIIDTVKPIGPVKATNALLSNPNPVLDPTAAEPNAFIGVTIGANTLRNIPKPPESLAIIPPKIPKPVSNGPSATTKPAVAPINFWYLESSSRYHLIPDLD